MVPIERIKARLRALGNRSGVEFVERVELSAWTTLRVGGLADLVVRCLSVEAVERVVGILGEEGARWLVLGGGSNVVLPDAGLRVPVVTFGGELAGWEVDFDGVVAGAGANLTPVIRAAVRSGLDGLVELAGIPGTLGGAAVMNAGAYGVELHDRLDWAEVVRPDGQRVRLDAAAIPHGYRWSALGEDGGIVTRLRLALEAGDRGEMRRRIREVLAERGRRLPLHRTAGSVFRNPDGEAAGRLLEVAGCKGLMVGKARVSTRHANVIVAERSARASEVLELVREMRRRVEAHAGIVLEPEIRFFDEEGRRIEP